MFRYCLILLLVLLCSGRGYAQCSAHPVTLTHQADVAFPLPKQCMSAVHDQAGRSYLYVAGKERGLLIYDVSNIAAPVLVDSIVVNSLDTMELMSVSQDGYYLYLALGNTFIDASLPGMAIVDVTAPSAPVLKSVWKYGTQSGGAGIVKVEGNYAYLGAMRRGLMILDITDKTNPILKSVLRPSISYPNPTSPDSLKYNARGMAVYHDIVYLCYDAGGIRIINAVNKTAPVETGHYSNPAIYSRPRAYNNLVLDDTLLYVAADYCGMEILSVADTSDITQVGWWNPWHCESVSNTWFNSPGHTNEIQYDPVCKDVFLASGKSELNVVNVITPASPDSCTKYTTTGGNKGVWGVALYQDQLFVCYIYVPLGIPFFSNWSGFKTLTWNDCGVTDVENTTLQDEVILYPNPAGDAFHLMLPVQKDEHIKISIADILGRSLVSEVANYSHLYGIDLNIGNLPDGNYIVSAGTGERVYYQRLVIHRN